jgi:hypothetical protein
MEAALAKQGGIAAGGCIAAIADSRKEGLLPRGFLGGLKPFIDLRGRRIRRYMSIVGFSRS